MVMAAEKLLSSFQDLLRIYGFPEQQINRNTKLFTENKVAAALSEMLSEYDVDVFLKYLVIKLKNISGTEHENILNDFIGQIPLIKAGLEQYSQDSIKKNSLSDRCRMLNGFLEIAAQGNYDTAFFNMPPEAIQKLIRYAPYSRLPEVLNYLVERSKPEIEFIFEEPALKAFESIFLNWDNDAMFFIAPEPLFKIYNTAYKEGFKAAATLRGNDVESLVR